MTIDRPHADHVQEDGSAGTAEQGRKTGLGCFTRLSYIVAGSLVAIVVGYVRLTGTLKSWEPLAPPPEAAAAFVDVDYHTVVIRTTAGDVLWIGASPNSTWHSDERQPKIDVMTTTQDCTGMPGAWIPSRHALPDGIRACRQFQVRYADAILSGAYAIDGNGRVWQFTHLGSWAFVFELLAYAAGGALLGAVASSVVSIVRE